MSLHGSALLYLFLDVSSIARGRAFFEADLGLPVVENQFHPPHEYHGIVKYAAGGVILSLNLGSARRLQGRGSDGLLTVLGAGRGPRAGALRATSRHPLTDVDGHHFAGEPAAPGAAAIGAAGAATIGSVGAATNGSGPHGVAGASAHGVAGASAHGVAGADRRDRTTIRRLELTVRDLAASMAFYGGVLGLHLVEAGSGRARFATGTIDLALREGASAPDGRPARTDAYLLVFHTPNVHASFAALAARGLRFRTQVGFSDIGGTARFSDPSGHTFCLYEPSPESLTWGSGDTVRQLAGAAAARRRA